MTSNPRTVLGFCSWTHDSAAALILDGQLVGFAEEERLIGSKHTKDYPAHAVDWLLGEGDLVPELIDTVAYNFRACDYLAATRQVGRQLADRDTRARALPRAASFARVAARTRTRTRRLGRDFTHASSSPILHHRAHGLYAFASSGYDDAAVVVVDSLGEIQTTTIAHARRTSGSGCRFDIIEAINDPASLGYAYGAVTEHLGWRRGDEEGTVMALAALGEPDRFRALMRDAIPITGTGFTLNPSLFPVRVLSRRFARVSAEFIARSCPPRGDGPIEQVHRDLAAALQERTEQVMVALALRSRALTGAQLLCVSGGVAANCVAIGKIVESGLFDEVHVPPAPGDSGTAIGAAIAAYLDHTGKLATGIQDHCYLGPAFGDVVLSTNPRPGLTATRPTHPAQYLAGALAAGAVVGVFRGPLEAGPRALGNRSILASPMHAEVVEQLNDTVKFREPFRPFAPVTLTATASDYFTLSQPAPYMSIASPVTDRAREQIPAIVHVNGTARVQTLSEGQNPFLAEVITQFAKITGVPVLINTSLNIKGKPICGTPDMALDCLLASGLDAMMLEDWWVSK
ncbi:carbamoyltransferase C-terminal domain-containing protein [Nocardia sp. CNY236]|uniref:carbamoyltransferase family protein n=1 Tax=Nocardia sp. CNY236 TaxID=1169152 RepID=UPI00041E7D23|nr:carbamoyltransferase C-terminal domain-containing protein [Nocardia sp. CNY236]